MTDSGWLDVDDVTALVGVNESGKTNLLLPLWKLNPAQEGELHPNADYPKAMFQEVRAAPSAYRFVEAEFELSDRDAVALHRLTDLPLDEVRVVRVSRSYDETYHVAFPRHLIEREAPMEEIARLFEVMLGDVGDAKPLKTEQALHEKVAAQLRGRLDDLRADDAPLRAPDVGHYAQAVGGLVPDEGAKTSTLVPRVHRLREDLEEVKVRLEAHDPGAIPEVAEAVRQMMPRFVYYSHYGNLDSEIYLPHVVENLRRQETGENLGAKEAAKARTLRVLFRFVGLEPQEILDLGREPEAPRGRPSDEDIHEVAESKKERINLLQGAGTKLTKRFRKWWKQGDYRFRFDADGNHFRIYVADDRRPEEVELDGRSAGLQWFLSFYLVFLVEAEEGHSNTILLLDEPGLQLHPLAQHDLSAFFDGLARENQLIYTTHSPFLVDTDRLERARKVYVADDGGTVATADLRQDEGRRSRGGASYAVLSALNMSVAESVLIGCHPVLVEGSSDQHHLTAIKSLLIGAGRIAPTRELVFPPCGGAKTVRPVAAMLTGRDETLPLVLLDGDGPGKRMAAELRSGLYVDAKDRVLLIDDYTGMQGSEIEDLMPAALVARIVDRTHRSPNALFEDVVNDSRPIVPQIEVWAEENEVPLHGGWKVQLAKEVKIRLLKRPSDIDGDVMDRWARLFEKLLPA